MTINGQCCPIVDCGDGVAGCYCYDEFECRSFRSWFDAWSPSRCGLSSVESMAPRSLNSALCALAAFGCPRSSRICLRTASG